MNTYNQIALRIIKYQEEIIGPVVWHIAEEVKGLVIVAGKNPEVAITSEPKGVINALVQRFEFLWGKLGILECRDATCYLTERMAKIEIPDSLK